MVSSKIQYLKLINFKYKYIDTLIVKGWPMINHANTNDRKQD